MGMKKGYVFVGAYVTPELHDRLMELAQEAGRSLSSEVFRRLRDSVEKPEVRELSPMDRVAAGLCI